MGSCSSLYEWCARVAGSSIRRAAKVNKNKRRSTSVEVNIGWASCSCISFWYLHWVQLLRWKLVVSAASSNTVVYWNATSQMESLPFELTRLCCSQFFPALYSTRQLHKQLLPLIMPPPIAPPVQQPADLANIESLIESNTDEISYLKVK